MSILNKINELIKEQGLMEDVELKMDTTFEELDLDSLDFVDLALSCEETFDIQLDLENPPKSVGELVGIIAEQIGADVDEEGADAEGETEE